MNHRAGTASVNKRDCLDLIREHLPGMNGAVRKVGTYLMTHAWESRGLTINEFADAAGASANAVIRFCQTLGYSGYREFTNELALSLGQAGTRSFSVPSEALPSTEADQPPAALVRRMFELEMHALQDTLHHLSDVLVERAITALSEARRVAFGAMGGTAQIAQLGYFRLLMQGVEAFWSSDPYVTMANAGLLEPGDVAFGISHSGQSRLTIEFLEFARERGATTIALTAVPGSPITGVADITLSVFGPDVQLSPSLQRFASRLAAMTLIEALVTAVAVQRFGTNPPQIDRTRAKLQKTLEPPITHPRRRAHP